MSRTKCMVRVFNLRFSIIVFLQLRNCLFQKNLLRRYLTVRTCLCTSFLNYVQFIFDITPTDFCWIQIYLQVRTYTYGNI
jgi:hypothetical protein